MAKQPSPLIADILARLRDRPWLADAERAALLDIILEYPPPTPADIRDLFRLRLASVPDEPDEPRRVDVLARANRRAEKAKYSRDRRRRG